MSADPLKVVGRARTWRSRPYQRHLNIGQILFHGPRQRVSSCSSTPPKPSLRPFDALAVENRETDFYRAFFVKACGGGTPPYRLAHTSHA